MKQSSFDAHDYEYKTTSDVVWHEHFYAENDRENLFFKMGFEKIFSMSKNAVDIYIDIGCGAGYLLKKASDYFSDIYGIEPSKAALNTAKQLNNASNIQYVNMTMTDGLEFLALESPFLATTSAVLSHIPDDEIVNFLKRLRLDAPLNSRIYFYEPYGKNIQTNLWHVRSRKWWIANLDGWYVEFLDIKDSGYLKGIYAEKRALIKVSGAIDPDFNEGWFKDALWRLSGLFYKARYALTRMIR